jgi:hypothetical protein
MEKFVQETELVIVEDVNASLIGVVLLVIALLIK